MIGFRVPAGVGTSLFTTATRPAMGPTQPPNQWVLEDLKPGVKRPGHEADNSPQTSAGIKNPWSYSSIHPYVFMAWCSVMPTDCTYLLSYRIFSPEVDLSLTPQTTQGEGAQSSRTDSCSWGERAVRMECPHCPWGQDVWNATVVISARALRTVIGMSHVVSRDNHCYNNNPTRAVEQR